MRWERDPPRLVQQWVGNKVVSVITTIGNANDRVEVNRKTRTAGRWAEKRVHQPKTIAMYNQYMNAVDRSDQLLTGNNVLRKCMRWWKVLFYHLIDIAVVNSYILFKEHQALFPDVQELHRVSGYSQADFREEIIRQLCDFPLYGDPPVSSASRSGPPPDPNGFETMHIPEFSDAKRQCVVCY